MCTGIAGGLPYFEEYCMILIQCLRINVFSVRMLLRDQNAKKHIISLPHKTVFPTSNKYHVIVQWNCIDVATISCMKVYGTSLKN